MSPLFESSASAALKMVHNLLLYSDERSAQLRKSLMQSDMVTRVLEPFLSRGVTAAMEASLHPTLTSSSGDKGATGDVAGLQSGSGVSAASSSAASHQGLGRMSARRVADRAVRHVSNALNALLVATFKMGTLRQRILVFGNAAPGGGVVGPSSPN